MKEFKRKVEDVDAGKVSFNEPLKNHTTFKIGGPARVFFEPHSISGLEFGLKEIKAKNLPWFVLGRGSNILVSDQGIDGVVLKLGEHMTSFKQEDEYITVESGFSLIKLATIMSKQGYSGLEFAGGIPGSVGGAVFMNAGAHQSDISSVLSKAYILLPSGECRWFNQKELAFGYRFSYLQEIDGICLAAQFRLKKGDSIAIRERLQRNKTYRKDTQPWKDPCCGSVFRNPLPKHAGKLIEDLGLKGFSIGGAKVSEKHANFIVNTGDATAKDVLELIKYIQKLVFEQHQIQLKTEVECFGL